MQPPDVQGKQVTVIGGARSGVAVARLLASAGAEVFVTEKDTITPERRNALDAADATYEMDGHTTRALDADLVVISPGVPATIDLVVQARDIGLPIYSEIEVASWFCEAPIIAITGTNGKTTTTRLTGHIFQTAYADDPECNVIVAGNIGNPISDYVREADATDVIVMEVSSFQLDHIDTFRPRISILLNITPDHLDRYDGDFDRYARSKCRIFENQHDGDVLIYNRDDFDVRDRVRMGIAQRSLRPMGLSLEQPVNAGAFVRRDNIVLRINDEEVLMPLDERASTLSGKHNLYNSLAAAVAARVMEVRDDVIRESLVTFEGVPHRLEQVRTIDDVRYVNDSKATNVNAVWYALESCDAPVVLIAGGRDKGNDYTDLKPLVRDKVRAVVAIGESADKVLREIGTLASEQALVASMDDAVQRAHELAESGDIVLLSPACSSFDMFENYKERGDTFRRLVGNL